MKKNELKIGPSTISYHNHCILIGDNLQSKCDGHILIKFGDELILDMVMNEDQLRGYKKMMGIKEPKTLVEIFANEERDT